MSDKLKVSKRVSELPKYVFSEINAFKADAKSKGIDLLSLAIGDPDLPTPIEIVKKLQEAAARPRNHMYSPYEGTFDFRSAVAAWLQKRFGVKVDPEKEVVALIGSKEGIAHFPVAFCNPGDKVLYPSPGYPIFSTGVMLAGGVPIPVPHRPENQFLPDVAEFEQLLRTHKPKYAILNYPCNPTSAVCPKEKLEALVNLALKYDTVLVSDNAYSEIYYDEKQRPVSLLEIPGAKDIAIEFHSFSKTFNMTGWRIAFAAGNAELVAGLLKVKTNIDSGPLLSVQEAAIYALEHADKLIPPIRAVYAERRQALIEGLEKANIEYFNPKATFFLWAKVPGNEPSLAFTKRMIYEQGLVVTPGSGFGAEGEGFFRLAMTVPTEQIRSAVTRLRA